MKAKDLQAVIYDQGRSVAGAYILGLPLIYTMETWWIGWRTPTWVLIPWAVGGLTLVMAITRFVGFREKEKGRKTDWSALAIDFPEEVATSLLATYALLLLFGILTLGSSALEWVRLGLIFVVPMALGSALANRILSPSDEQKKGEGDASGPRILAIFAVGSLTFALPFAPTEEMALMTTHAGWTRLTLLVAAAILLTYGTMYELDFQGQEGRTSRLPGPGYRWGEVFSGYAIAFVLSAVLLAGFGQFNGIPLPEAVARTIVLSFIASFGGAAAQVVI